MTINSKRSFEGPVSEPKAARLQAENPALSEDMLGIVAKFLPDEELLTYAAVNNTCRVAALKERATRVLTAVKAESMQILNLAPVGVERSYGSPIAFYKTCLADMHDRAQQVIIPEGQLRVSLLPGDQAQTDQLKQELNAIITNHVKNKQLAFNLSASTGQLAWGDIESQSRDSTYTLMAQALSRIIEQSPEYMRALIKEIALEHAINYGSSEVFNILLGRPSGLWDDIRGRLVLHAGFKNQYEIFQTLLDDGAILEHQRRSAISMVGHSGNRRALVEALLARGDISQAEYDSVCFRAASSGDHDWVKDLVSQGHISASGKGYAVQAALNGNHYYAIALTLLPGATIEQFYRERFLLDAISNQNLELTTALLENGPISDLCRGRAIDCAARLGHQEILHALNGNGVDSEKRRGELLSPGWRCSIM